MELPGGGVIATLATRAANNLLPELLVLEQTRSDGRRYRWLCSRSAALLSVETVVEVTEKASCPTRSGATVFRRDVLLPAYHCAMVAGLGLGSAAPLRSLLFLGVGGGALPLHLAEHYPRCRMTGVEVDEHVLVLARQYFGLASGPRLRLHAGDAVDFLRRRRDASLHDAILLDASSRGVAPPPALAELALLRRLRARLRHGGVLVINVLGTARHVSTVQATLAQAFAAADDRRCRIDTDEGNVVLAAVRGGRASARGRGAGRDRDTCGARTGPRDERVWRSACDALGLRVIAS